MPLRGLVKNNVLKMMETMYSGKADTFDNSIESIGNNKTVDIGVKLLAMFDKAKCRVDGILSMIKP